MQTGNPFTITCAAAWTIASEHARDIEHKSAMVLDEHHHSGEWFKCSKERAIQAVTSVLTNYEHTAWIRDVPRALPRKKKVIVKNTTFRSGKRVTTPRGEFYSITAAAKDFGVTKQAIWKKVHKGIHGWTFS